MTRRTLLTYALGAGVAGARITQPRLVDVRKIWDQGGHNAFTDLIRYRGRWYCAFREGSAHVSPDGAMRILTSTDGARWTSAALLTSQGDLRDAKLSITPDKQLMLSGAEAYPSGSAIRHQSLAWFSRDGRKWSAPAPVGEPNVWLWRVTWNGRIAYGAGYSTVEPRFLRMYFSRDGRKFEPLADKAYDDGYPNETSLIFPPGGGALCLLRRDGGTRTALLGTSVAPYRVWNWKDLGVRIGGPHVIRLRDGRLVAAVRLYDGGPRTSLCWLDPAALSLTEFLTLPSGGDTSYAGLVFHKGLLWTSYYSSHEGKTSIYLAKVELPDAS